MDQALPKFEIIFTSSARPVLINRISNVAVISVGMTLLWTPPFNIVRLMVVTFARGYFNSFNFLFSFCRYSVILPTTWFNFSPAVLSKNIPPCPDWPWKMRSKSQMVNQNPIPATQSAFFFIRDINEMDRLKLQDVICVSFVISIIPLSVGNSET